MSVPAKSASAHRLADVPLFAGLVDSALDELARESRVRRYSAGQVLWNEGDPGDALLVLEEGQLRVSRFTAAGVEVVLSVVEAPSALGELALLDGAPRDASVTAQRPVTVRLIPRSSSWPSCAASQRSWKGCCAPWPAWSAPATLVM